MAVKNVLKFLVKAICPPFVFWGIKSILNLFKPRNQCLLKTNNGIDSGSIELYHKSFGNKNKNKCFYIIKGFEAGMFSTLQYVLAHIRLAEMMNMIPVVDFENFHTVFSCNPPAKNEKNIWLCFFKPISSYTLQEVYSSKNVFFGSGKYRWDMGHYFSDDGFFEIYKKYINIQDEIVVKIESYKKEFDFANKRILGVQFRGWEQNIAAGHPFGPTVKQMFKYTDEIINKYNIDKIYLATEQQEYHDAFINRYGNKVIYTPYFRTKKGLNGYKIYPEPRANHLYQCGVEIIINAFLLSECIGLIHSGTNVSTFSKFINNGKYEFEYFINNGVNSKNYYLSKIMYDLKKHLPKKYGGLKDEVIIHNKEI